MAISFKYSQIAVDQSVPVFVKKIAKAQSEYIANLQTEKTACKASSIVLAILAVISAAGAMTLLLYSSGFTDIAVSTGGIALGCLSLGLIIWIVVRTCKAMKQEAQFKQEYTDVLNEQLTAPEILEAMHLEDTTKEHIHRTLLAMRSDTNTDIQFVEFVLDQYFGPEKPPLDDDQRKVLDVLTQAPVFKKIDLEKYPRPLAVEVLQNRHPSLNDGQNNAKLLVKMGEPISLEEVKILAHLPQEIAQLSGSHSAIYSPELVIKIIKEMSEEQNTQLLRSLINEMESKKSPERVNHLQAMIEAGIQHVLSIDFANQFAQPELPQESIALLEQLARVPTLVAKQMMNHSDLLKSGAFIQALSANMGEEGFQKYIKACETIINSSTSYSRVITEVMNEHQTKLPPLLSHLFARLPGLLSNIWQKLNVTAQRMVLALVCNNMTGDNQVIFLNTAQNSKSNLFSMMFAVLAKSSLSTVILYLNAHCKGDELRTCVLDEAHFEKDEGRWDIALLILNQVDTKVAERLLTSIDRKSLLPSYDNYNQLAKILNDKIKSSAEEKWGTLAALFRYAPDSKFNNSLKSVFGSNLRNSDDWALFRELAEKYRHQVWQK